VGGRGRAAARNALTAAHACVISPPCAPQYRRDVIEVLPGFYSEGLLDPGVSNATTGWDSNSSRFGTESIPVGQCPNPLGCLGGTAAGNASCLTGHAGLLCAICAPGYYGDRRNCNSCEATGHTAQCTHSHCIQCTLLH
jgi:hypothetical protein